MYSIVSVDLDRTLLIDGNKISPEARELLISFQKQGGILVISTGRKLRETSSIIADLEMEKYRNGYVVFSSGAFIYELASKKILNLGKMSNTTAHNVIKNVLAAMKNMRPIVVTQACDYVAYSKYSADFFIKNVIYKIRKRNIRCIALDSIKSFPEIIEKIILPYDPTMNYSTIVGKLQDITCRIIDGRKFEIYSNDTDKALGLKRVLELEGKTKEDILIFGDDENDILSFETFPHTVAMGNAIDVIKNLASYSTDSFNENGVYNFLKKLFDFEEYKDV